MRAPVSWLREMVAIPADQTGRDIAEKFINAGLEVETVERIGEGVIGELIVGRVESIEELAEFKKPIRWCQVDVGQAHGRVRGIICGARNFQAGDLVVVALPGTTLPGGFTITARETYGHVSDGMICSERELGLGDAHDGIMVLAEEAAAPGDDAGALIGVGDEVLDIAVTPDRGYALSIRGLARELAIAYGVDFDDPGQRMVDLPAPDATKKPAECAIDDLVGCQLFTLRTLVDFDPSKPTPLWMQRRLIACGMRPVSLAVDVTNYVMLELGQPLHAFDLNKLQGAVRPGRANPNEVFETLDHVKRNLNPDDLVIRDDRGTIGLAGVMGGLESEIDDETTAIALEAAYFDSGVIARVGRRHKLSSEASRRFERGVDRAIAPYASARAMALLLEHGGGHYVGMTAVEAPHEPSIIRMRADYPASVAGMEIATSTVVDLLTNIGCEVAVEGDDIGVIAPTWRPDITDPADLAEEVIRLIGYDQLPTTLPTSALGHGMTAAQRMRRRVGTALAARGQIEVLSYPFVGATELDALRVEESDAKRSKVKLANPLSDEQPFLRASLLPGLVAAAKRNIGRGQTDLRIFEIGKVFAGQLGTHVERPSVERKPSDAEWAGLNGMLPEQPTFVASLLIGDVVPQGAWGSARAVDWSDALEAAKVVADALGLDVTIERGDDPTFHPGRCARLVVNGTTIGVAGELHPRVIEATELPSRSCAMELDLSTCIDHAPAVRPAPSVGTQPVAKEDLALVVNNDVTVAEVERAIREGAGPLLESVRLFDVYTGSQVPEGHKSLAFALRFRAPDRTLEPGESEAARQAALAKAQERCGAQLR